MLASIRRTFAIRRERIVMCPLFRKIANIRRDFVHQGDHALFQLD
jgi:hypothetical protein